eukprot:Anaeramoba_ignava/a609335_117.p1 GENE.a609335_117~~a609335_117.p1  ORF type:complete len:549 (+),score=135.60 a609335_117:54-1700(+)
MNSKQFLSIIISIIFAFELVINEEKTIKIAIIGSGIGGSSTAYWIEKLRNEKYSDTQLSITVYEQEKETCGRVRSRDIGEDTMIEAGATIFHVSNKYMVDFADEFGLAKYRVSQNPHISKSMTKFGFWHENDFLMQQSSSSLLTKFKIGYNFGFFDLLKTNRLSEEMKNKFCRIYDLQAQGISFETTKDLYQTINMFELSQESLKNYLKNFGLSKMIYDVFASMALRGNIGEQDPGETNALGGLICLIAEGKDLYTVNQGNQKICDNLIQSSKNAILKLNHAVKEIRYQETTESRNEEKDPSQKHGEYVLRIQNNEKSGSLETEVYDAVVFAAPFHSDKIKIEIPDFDPKIYEKEYIPIYSTFITGDVNPSYFGKESVPTEIYTTYNSSLQFTTLSLKTIFKNGTKLFRLFSKTPITQEILQKLFFNGKIVDEYRHEYPLLKINSSNTPFRFGSTDSHVYFVNAMEIPFSVMETEAIGGLNVAHLFFKDFFGEKFVFEEQHNEVTEEEHTDIFEEKPIEVISEQPIELTEKKPIEITEEKPEESDKEL